MEAGSGEKVEEFVVLHQEPSASEAISPRVARPYIQALHSIDLDAPSEEGEQQQVEEGLAGTESAEEAQELESQAAEEPAHIEELNAVMEQVNIPFYLFRKLKMKELKENSYSISLTLYYLNQQLTPIERYALHYLEYLHISDDETALQVSERVI